MALIVADRVKETSTTTGTGAFTLAGAMTAFRAFSAVCTSPSDTCYYCIQAVNAGGSPTGEWEVGLGTYSAANTLTRTTVLSSSTGSAIDFAAGTKQVWIDIPAYLAQMLASNGQIAFPATQNSSAGANVLDDYEEGTHNPTVSCQYGTITSYTASGSYTKIGNCITHTWVVTITDKGTGSGNLYVTSPGGNYAASWSGAGREVAINGYLFSVSGNAGSTGYSVAKYDNSTMIATNAVLTSTVTYLVAT